MLISTPAADKKRLRVTCLSEEIDALIARCVGVTNMALSGSVLVRVLPGNAPVECTLSVFWYKYLPVVFSPDNVLVHDFTSDGVLYECSLPMPELLTMQKTLEEDLC